jgi:hypothetical protein
VYKRQETDLELKEAYRQGKKRKKTTVTVDESEKKAKGSRKVKFNTKRYK